MNGREYYVYVYIDPRSYEEFYYGKGRGNRKEAHLLATGASEKVGRIREIRKAGLAPIIRVVASNLTQEEALLVEKTLIWKLGRTLTNVSPGHYAQEFRPHNTLHVELPGFDFAHDVYYVNVGEGRTRSWEDCRKYGFLAAGGHPKWSDQIRQLRAGDVVVAYLKKAGYVGVGKVEEAAVPVARFLYRGRPLLDFELQQRDIHRRAADLRKSEYLVRVKWVKAVPRSKAVFKRNAGLFTSTLVRASLARQEETRLFVEEHFRVSFERLLRSSRRSHSGLKKG